MARLATMRRHGVRALALALGCLPLASRAAEHITLRNGFELDCVRRELLGDKMRLYFATAAGAPENFMEVPAESVLRVETVADAPLSLPASVVLSPLPASTAQPTKTELAEMLSHAGAQHNIDADLLASLVHAESGGHAQAVSRTGARGLMQLMPGTAAALGVADAFVPAQNVEGGTRYLDQLLTRYHDNIALALAAYNAGPGAVDRYQRHSAVS